MANLPAEIIGRIFSFSYPAVSPNSYFDRELPVDVKSEHFAFPVAVLRLNRHWYQSSLPILYHSPRFKNAKSFTLFLKKIKKCQGRHFVRRLSFKDLEIVSCLTDDALSLLAQVFGENRQIVSISICCIHNTPSFTRDALFLFLTNISSPRLTHIRLQNIAWLDNLCVQAVLRLSFPSLRSLLLSGCPRLADVCVIDIPEFCPRLERLALDQLARRITHKSIERVIDMCVFLEEIEFSPIHSHWWNLRTQPEIGLSARLVNSCLSQAVKKQNYRRFNELRPLKAYLCVSMPWPMVPDIQVRSCIKSLTLDLHPSNPIMSDSQKRAIFFARLFSARPKNSTSWTGLQNLALHNFSSLTTPLLDFIISQCPRLSSLVLTNVYFINNEAIQVVHTSLASTLKWLALTGSKRLTDDAWIFDKSNIESTWPKLRGIDISGSSKLTYKSIEAIVRSAPELDSLIAHCCPNLLNPIVPHNSSGRIIRLVRRIFRKNIQKDRVAVNDERYVEGGVPSLSLYDPTAIGLSDVYFKALQVALIMLHDDEMLNGIGDMEDVVPGDIGIDAEISELANECEAVDSRLVQTIRRLGFLDPIAREDLMSEARQLMMGRIQERESVWFRMDHSSIQVIREKLSRTTTEKRK